jgi:hypothetical protein
MATTMIRTHATIREATVIKVTSSVFIREKDLANDLYLIFGKKYGAVISAAFELIIRKGNFQE